jgi:D-alanine-D-alanine ligase-like ATP-grasp enzyme
MDKAMFKLLLAGQHISQTKFVTIDLQLMNKTDITKKIHEIKKTLALPLYVKPANS